MLVHREGRVKYVPDSYTGATGKGIKTPENNNIKLEESEALMADFLKHGGEVLRLPCCSVPPVPTRKCKNVTGPVSRAAPTEKDKAFMAKFHEHCVKVRKRLGLPAFQKPDEPRRLSYSQALRLRKATRLAIWERAKAKGWLPEDAPSPEEPRTKVRQLREQAEKDAIAAEKAAHEDAVEYTGIEHDPEYQL